MKKVLLVEDNPLAQMMIQDALEGAGFSVQVVEHWADVARALHGGDIAAVVVDLGLPGVSGETMANLISRKSETSPGVVIHSGAPVEELRRVAARVDAAAYVEKGQDLSLLVSAVRQAAASWQARVFASSPPRPGSTPPAAKAFGARTSEPGRPPALAMSPGTLPPPRPSPEPGAAGKVLIVDDDADLLELTCNVLRRAHFEVTGVNDWIDVTRELFGGKFDLIVLDLSLPTVDGVELARMIRESHTPAPPILFWSAEDQIELATRAAQEGVAGSVPKAGGTQLLLARIRDTLRKAAPKAAAG